ncbi:hypothetical protein DXG03_005679 [Asterophora parasitica]|uniref:Uncharacterized protein n=1 Tax=Asterophora parasitica TaxID=117018 RepID=A0A9P7K9S8_9AGAR|nr:hypothetical protein DXG03_005679 [Asterophora parasitica]
MNPESANAEAGPSTTRLSTPSASFSSQQLFLPPPGLLSPVHIRSLETDRSILLHPTSNNTARPEAHPTYLSSTQDLLARFNLLPSYDKYVRPFAAPAETGLDQVGPTPATPGANGVVDKGKGKEVEVVPVTPGGADGGDGDDDEGGKRKRNNYKHLIKGIPGAFLVGSLATGGRYIYAGKHSTKKDDYLMNMMQVPPKQRIHITPFDLKTQREAFTVSLEGLKGWNPGALVLESAQAREDRKKRKEAKRLQKLQAQAQTQAAIAPPQPIQAPRPTSASTASFNRPPQPSVSNGTPRPSSAASSRPTPPLTAATAVQRPGSTVPRPGSAAPKLAVARPGSTVSRPGSTVPRPGSTKPVLPPVQLAVGRIATPLRSGAGGPGTPLRSATTATPTSANPYTQLPSGGQKREREDSVTGTNGIGATNVDRSNIPPALANNVPKAVMNAKAGTAGIRPRPVKKQRMVSTLACYVSFTLFVPCSVWSALPPGMFTVAHPSLL